MFQSTKSEELWNDLINNNSRENCCMILGTTIPTLQRWISQDKYPVYVDIILDQLDDLKTLQVSYNSLANDKKNIEFNISEFMSSLGAMQEIAQRYKSGDN